MGLIGRIISSTVSRHVVLKYLAFFGVLLLLAIKFTGLLDTNVSLESAKQTSTVAGFSSGELDHNISSCSQIQSVVTFHQNKLESWATSAKITPLPLDSINALYSIFNQEATIGVGSFAQLSKEIAANYGALLKSLKQVDKKNVTKQLADISPLIKKLKSECIKIGAW